MVWLFKLIPCANNCYWIFSLKSDKGLPTSATGISIDISLLLLKMYSYSYLLHIYQIVAWHAFLKFLYYIMNMYNLHDCIDIEFLTKNCLCRKKWCKKNPTQPVNCVIIHAYNQCRSSAYVCAIQWIRCWQEILCMFCFSGQKRLQLLPVVWWESLTRETWNEKSD